MIYNIVDFDSNEIYGTIKVAKNCKNIVKKASEELGKIFCKDVRMLFTGKVDMSTGETTGHYVAFGIKKNIKLEVVE